MLTAAQPVVAAEHAVGRDAVAVVGHLHRLDALVPELADVAAHRDATGAAASGSFSTMKQVMPSSVRAASAMSPALAVGDPRLRPVDDVLVAVAHGLAGERARVAAGVGLGERQRSRGSRPPRAREPLPALLVGAVELEQVRRHHVGVEHARERHPPGGQLLDHAAVGGEVEPEPVVRLGDRDAEQPELAHRRHDRGRVLVGVLEVGRDRDHVALDEATHRRDQLFAYRCIGPITGSPSLQRRSLRVLAERVGELRTPAHAQLLVRALEMVLDGPRAHEQLLGDLAARQAVRGQLGDLPLTARQRRVVGRRRRARADGPRKHRPTEPPVGADLLARRQAVAAKRSLAAAAASAASSSAPMSSNRPTTSSSASTVAIGQRLRMRGSSRNEVAVGDEGQRAQPCDRVLGLTETGEVVECG